MVKAVRLSFRWESHEKIDDNKTENGISRGSDMVPFGIAARRINANR